MWELSLLHVTCLSGPPLHFYKTFGFRVDHYITKMKERVVSLACDMPTGPPFNLYQILSYYLNQYGSYSLHKISASEFCFRGDNYITKKVRVVSLARDTPTGHPLHPYQILSKYLKQYGSNGLHKILFRGDKYIRHGELSLLHTTYLLVFFISTKHYQNMS